MNAPVQTMQQLMAQALAMEREAVARYGELAEMMVRSDFEQAEAEVHNRKFRAV